MALKFVYTDTGKIAVANERSMGFNSHSQLGMMIDGNVIKAGFIANDGQGFGHSIGYNLGHGGFDLNDYIDDLRCFVTRDDDAIMLNCDFKERYSYLGAIELALPSEIIGQIGIQEYLGRFR